MPYGVTTSGRMAALRIGAGSEYDSPVLDLDTGGLVLRAHVDAQAIPLYPTRGFVVADALIPLSSASLTLRGATAGALTLTLGLPGTLVVPPGASLTFERPCSDVNVSQQRFDPLDAFGGAGSGRQATLPKGRTLPLTLSPGGPTVVELRTRNGDDLNVTVLEEKQRISRIAWETGDVLAVGWLASSLLSNATSRGNRPGPGFSLGTVHTMGGVIRCAHEVVLVAQVDGERRSVGRILPGTRMVLDKEIDEYQQATLVGVHASPSDAAVWMVKRSAISDCE
jgi:hypothetical protein